MAYSIKLLVSLTLVACCLIACASPAPVEKEEPFEPSPDEALALLKEGNQRFYEGNALHPHMDMNRVILASQENQARYAYATVIGCADSRVPVELIFDVGIMDLFVIRVAGNVCNADECGCIEYGLAHVHCPLLVILGHTQCGAVTVAAQAVQGHDETLERNIPKLIDSIKPAVKRAMALYPDKQGDDIIPYAVEENVYEGIEDLFMASPRCRELVKKGEAKVVGAVYEIETGKVRWLPESKSHEILKKVSKNPDRAKKAMARE